MVTKMANPTNMGVFTGKLGADPVFFGNKDGSAKVKLSMYAQDNYKGRDGKTGSVRGSFEAFIDAAKVANNYGVYGLIHKGDLISVTFEIRNNDYEKNGQMVYEEVNQITNVMLLESKAVTSQRQAARTAAENAAAATQG